MKNDLNHIDIFVHVPKTGGSTIRQILSINYPVENQFMFSGYYYEYESFVNQLNVHKKNLQLLHGHAPYGLHSQFTKAARYFTFLRHPLDRLVSDYLFSFKKESGFHKLTYPKLSLEDFIYYDNPFLKNPQIKWIAGFHPQKYPSVSEKKILKIAKQRLINDYLCFGITERFNESILYMAAKLDWKAPLYSGANVSGITKNALNSLSRAALDFFTKKNKEDLEFYEFALEHFNSIISRQKPLYWEALAEYKKKLSEIKQKTKQNKVNTTYEIKRDGIIQELLSNENEIPKVYEYLSSEAKETKMKIPLKTKYNYSDKTENLLKELKNEREELYNLAETRLEEIKNLVEKLDKIKAGLRKPEIINFFKQNNYEDILSLLAKD